MHVCVCACVNVHWMCVWGVTVFAYLNLHYMCVWVWCDCVCMQANMHCMFVTLCMCVGDGCVYTNL